VESDVTKLDQSVIAKFVELYFSTMLVYEKKGTPEYEMKEKIVKYLITHFVQRLTHLFGEIWANVIGGVPSGAFNTSHMDSWILLLWFCLFCAYQICNAPDSVKPELELLLREIIRIAVYGDDNVWNKSNTPLSSYFSGVAFQAFMKDNFNVVVKDLKDGIQFLSEQREGWLTNTGCCFLKHYFVLNMDKREGQPRYLPFRETREFIVRAVWGRSGATRDGFDCLLSIIGHAYGTYASNSHAYNLLLTFYNNLIDRMQISRSDIGSLFRTRLTPLTSKEMRKRGISEAEILDGFPTWETLVLKNKKDESYENFRSIPEILKMSD